MRENVEHKTFNSGAFYVVEVTDNVSWKRQRTAIMKVVKTCSASPHVTLFLKTNNLKQKRFSFRFHKWKNEEGVLVSIIVTKGNIFRLLKAGTGGVLYKKVFLEISQNSKNTFSTEHL